MVRNPTGVGRILKEKIREVISEDCLPCPHHLGIIKQCQTLLYTGKKAYGVFFLLIWTIRNPNQYNTLPSTDWQAAVLINPLYVTCLTTK